MHDLKFVFVKRAKREQLVTTITDFRPIVPLI